MRKSIVNALALVFVPFSVFATGKVNLGSFHAYSESAEILKSLRTNACARAALISVKENIVDEAAVEAGTDLPEDVSVLALAKLADDSFQTEKIYSVSVVVDVGDVVSSYKVQTKRNGKKCQAKKPYISEN